MDDIPMTDIIVRQPSRSSPTQDQCTTFSDNCDTQERPQDHSNTTSNNGGDPVPDNPTTIGLGPLRNALTLTIKQRIRAFDIISLCTGCEVI